MLIGIHAFGRDAGTPSGVARARSVGAEGVCLGLEAIQSVAADPNSPDQALRDAVHRYQDAGIEVPAGYAGRFSDAMMLGDAGAEAEYGGLLRQLERLASVGINSVLYYTTPSRPADPRDEHIASERFLGFCTRLGEDAAAIRIGIACHPWLSRPELIHGFQRLEEMCRRIGQAQMGITFCPGGTLAGDDMKGVLDRLRDRIHFAHLRDQIGAWQSFEEVFPGTGEAAIPALVKGLRDSGYAGLMCPEHLGPAAPGQDLEADAIAYAKRLRDS